MTTPADQARASAISIEVKKDGLQQRQDGSWVLRLTMHPQQMDTNLINAPMGTRYVAALVEVGDDEQPITRLKGGDAAEQIQPRSQLDTSLRSQHETVNKPPLSAGGAKRRWGEIPFSQQAALKCRDLAFRKFLAEEPCRDYQSLSSLIGSEDEDEGAIEYAAECVRRICRINSRAEIKRDTDAGERWMSLMGLYYLWQTEPAVVG